MGIVGPSGAGKSTLISLLLRYWDIERGRIWLDGQDIRDYAPQDVRKMLAVVDQRPYLFHGTLRSNLLLAAPGANDADLHQALRLAQLEPWVSTLPQGLDTPVGERGNQVSGGERQRLAVARALLQDAPLWLLDEPTAHLDPRSRQSVARNLARGNPRAERDLGYPRTQRIIRHGRGACLAGRAGRGKGHAARTARARRLVCALEQPTDFVRARVVQWR